MNARLCSVRNKRWKHSCVCVYDVHTSWHFVHFSAQKRLFAYLCVCLCIPLCSLCQAGEHYRLLTLGSKWSSPSSNRPFNDGCLPVGAVGCCQRTAVKPHCWPSPPSPRVHMASIMKRAAVQSPVRRRNDFEAAQLWNNWLVLCHFEGWGVGRYRATESKRACVLARVCSCVYLHVIEWACGRAGWKGLLWPVWIIETLVHDCSLGQQVCLCVGICLAVWHISLHSWWHH